MAIILANTRAYVFRDSLPKYVKRRRAQTMSKIKLVLASSAIVLAIVGVSAALPAKTRPQPAQAQQSDKYDGGCTGHETQGRCADKCPPGTYQIGIDERYGSAICKNEPTGCPYGDSIPLGPECDKHKPVKSTVKPAQPPKAAQCGGK